MESIPFHSNLSTKVTMDEIINLMKENGFTFTGREDAEYHNCGYLAVYKDLNMDSVLERVNDVVYLEPSFTASEIMEVIHDWIYDSMVYSRG